MWFSKAVSKNASAVVTGAGSGIGQAFAVEIARRGGHVVCADIHLGRARATAKQIGKQAHAVAVDVSDADAVAVLADKAEHWLGTTPDLVINNAGVAGGDRVGAMSLEDWHWVVNVNLWGAIHGCHVFAPRLVAAGRGAILNVASSAAFVAAPGMAAYNVSKAGVLSLSETLAAELSGSGVRVAALCPTMVKTNLTQEARAPDAMRALADRLMARGVTPEFIAKYSLDALDRDEFYILPQADARAMWRMKRHFPLTYTRLAGGIGRLADRYMKSGD